MSVQLYLKGRAFKMHPHNHIRPGSVHSEYIGETFPSSLREPEDEYRPDL